MLRLRGLTFHLSFMILSSTAIIFILLYSYNLYESKNILYNTVEKNATYICMNNAKEIEKVLSSVEKIALTTKNYIETNDFTAEELNAYQTNIVKSNSEVFGSSICFEPYQFDSTKKLFSVYYYKDGEIIRQSDLGTDDYYYPNHEWYNKPKRENKPVWSEPYFDEGGGGVLMTTISVPFYKSVNGEFWGIITCDISLSWLRELIAQNKAFQNSYGFVISQQGKLLAHPDSSIVMKKDIFDVAKERNQPILNELGKRMMAGEEGSLTSISIITKKKSLIRYYPIKSNGWATGVVFPEDEIHSDMDNLLLKVIIFGAIGFLLLFVIIVFISKKITQSLNIITSSAEQIAIGNLKEASDISKEQWSGYQSILDKIARKDTKVNNEIIRLYIAINKMTNNLFGLIEQVKKSGIQVGSSATEISASSRELEANVSEQAASTKEVSATSKNISDTSQNLSESIQDINERAVRTLHSALEGKDSLSTMDEALKGLNSSTKSITTKLSVISEKANKISNVVVAINKISEQTNLLSFNASIESEKAGEYGKGFSVVAREISRLAEQTAVATEDIEKIVREMQSSVSSGVMEMDKFSEEVRKNSENIYAIAELISTIIDEVRDFAPNFSEFAQGMSEQAEAAEQISDSMTQLTKASELSKNALNEFRKITSHLNDAVGDLQKEVNKFTL